jgi:hypothetical protein
VFGICVAAAGGLILALTDADVEGAGRCRTIERPSRDAPGEETMVERKCAACGRAATRIIPAADEFVCVEHAAEFWQALLHFAVGRRRPPASPQPAAAEWQEMHRGDRQLEGADLDRRAS